MINKYFPWKSVFFVLFFSSISLYSQSYNIFDHKPNPGYVLENWYARIGSFPSKNSEPFYIPDYDKNYSLLKNFSIEKWNPIKLPFEFKKISGKSKLFSISILHEFKLNELNLNPDKELSLHIPYFNMNMDIFFNGKKIAEIGKTDIENQQYIKYGYRRYAIIKLPQELFQENNEIVLILYSIYPDMIRLDKVFSDIPIEINYYEEHHKIYNETISFMLLFLYFFVGAYHLLLFIKRPKEIYNLWFGLFAIALTLYYITRTTFIYYITDNYSIDTFLITKIEYSIIFSASLWGVLFFEGFHYNRLTILSKIAAIIIAFYIIIIWFFNYYFASEILAYWQKTALLIILYTLGITIYYSIWKKNKDSRRIVFGMFILAITVILDILGAMNIGLQNYQLARFGFFAFIMGIALVLANKFLRVYREVEELNLHLEEKVKERTKELQQSLEQIQKLKEQQDGDYFLTSLLIQPLIYESVYSEVINVQSYIKEKKEFQFRHWKREIGGDINIIQDIVLKGKPYVFIFNGDAMGKSLQGAGGALVAGVIIKAILTRTLLYPEYQNRYPEKWLKELFIELHKVFESFDGSMLLSGFLGLIEEFTGTLYFIYAEHPYPVLYRNQKAEFLDNTTEFRKFGTPGLMGKIYILVKKLDPNDILFVGSDGKDDLIINQNGEEIINEDETLFLRLVEKSKGNLEELIHNINQTGKLMDDISIIRISYKENQKEIEQGEIITPEEKQQIINKINILKREKKWNELKNYLEEINKKYYNQEFILRHLIDVYYRLMHYSKVISEGKQYLEAYPYDNDILYRVSRAYLLTQNYEEAQEFAERLDLREPNHISNLITLVYCHNQLKERKKAIKVLNRLLDLAPEKEEVKKLRMQLLGY
ncbi:MAG: signal transduction protein [Leptospiraceae bacterium]|nr:MAG: signal transduction protein [Leptospiraceae bacterium]